MVRLAFLYEHASGYSIIKCKCEGIESIQDAEIFKMHAFHPYPSALSALEQCNAVSEGIIHDQLNQFLAENLESSKCQQLYVQERKLADAIRSEIQTDAQILFDSQAADVFRLIRVIFPSMVSQLCHWGESKAQIGLGHSYSRAKVKFNVNRADNMIMLTINLLDQIDKDINTFSMRVKEWFSYHFPELVRIVPENDRFVHVVGLIASRDGITDETVPQLQEILQDDAKVNQIIECAKTSVGFDISDDDVVNLNTFTQRICALIERRKATYDYLVAKMEGVAPNLSTLIGDQVAARLIAHAGSLTKLAKFPASTIQILGAEKALFRALKTRSNTPKYGIIFHSSYIGRAARENKGRISRFLAAKCAIASRIDCFSDNVCGVYGKHLQKQVEDRLEFFKTGVRAETNREAMAKAVAEANEVIRKLKKKALKTLQKRAAAEAATNGDSIEPPPSGKKRKMKQETECEA